MSVRPRMTALLSILLLFFTVTGAGAAERDYRHIVVLGDPHLPGETLAYKERVRTTINGWADVDLVVALGDITQEVGDQEEYGQAKHYFASFTKPLAPIGGNHDYLYEDRLGDTGAKIRAGEAIRTEKLNRFKESFGLPEVYYAKVLDPYLLVFLTTDDLQASTLATISTAQSEWFSRVLSANRQRPTIAFFHAPLIGTLAPYNRNANSASFVAQPIATIRQILADHPQLFLWVSGHTHTPPSEPSFASDVNRYAGRVTNIHTTDMERKRIFTNSLFLYADRVTVKTFDHGQGRWMDPLERTIPIPGGPAAAEGKP